MLDLFTDSKTVVFLFLLAVLGLLILSNPTGKPQGAQINGVASQTWSLDYDGGGMYPASDCGRNYWSQLHPGIAFPGSAKQPCVVNVQNADPINQQATQEMKDDGADLFQTDEDLLFTFRDYVGTILERIVPAW